MFYMQAASAQDMQEWLHHINTALLSRGGPDGVRLVGFTPPRAPGSGAREHAAGEGVHTHARLTARSRRPPQAASKTTVTEVGAEHTTTEYEAKQRQMAAAAAGEGAYYEGDEFEEPILDDDDLGEH